MKKRKTIDENPFATEMLEELQEFGIKIMTAIVSKICSTEQMFKSIFIAIPKIQGTLECNKHRPSAL